MTEIPEHLLARSKARRQAIGQDEGGDASADVSAGGPAAGGDAPAASAAVEKAGAAAAPAGVEPAAGLAPAKAPSAPALPPEKPKRPEVVAAESRKKIPSWAVPAVVALPVWAFLYAFTLDPPTEGLSPALAEGEHLYGSGGGGCDACHGSDGGGGVGPAFANGAVVETFSSYEDHVQWVTIGSNGWRDQVGATYGDTEKPVLGFNGNPMPAFEGTLTEEEILLVVRYEREIISGFGCEPELAELTEEECAPGTEAAEG